jgi:predicted aspartyl protease
VPVISFRATKQKVEGGETEPAPEVLAMQGPVLPVLLSISEEVQQALMSEGKPIPEPVTGLALIDTGATFTCVDETAARRAGLPIRGTAKMASASHPEHEVPVFAGRISMDGININTSAAMGADLSGFPDLVALIGRDMLQNCLFVYDGNAGSISLAF